MPRLPCCTVYHTGGGKEARVPDSAQTAAYRNPWTAATAVQLRFASHVLSNDSELRNSQNRKFCKGPKFIIEFLLAHRRGPGVSWKHPWARPTPGTKLLLTVIPDAGACPCFCWRPGNMPMA